MIEFFDLKIYKGKRTEFNPECEVSGEGEEWAKYSRLSFPGFDGSIKLSLEDVWHHVINNQIESHQQQVEGLESIVKFGDVMQLKEIYTVVIRASFK